MAKFKVGDRVKYVGRKNGAPYGKILTVVKEPDSIGRYIVRWDSDHNGFMAVGSEGFATEAELTSANAARSRNAVVQKAMNAWVPSRGSALGYQWKETSAERRIKSELRAAGAKSADYHPSDHWTSKPLNLDSLAWVVTAEEGNLDKVAAKMRQLGMADVSKPIWYAYDDYHIVGYTKIDPIPANAVTQKALNATTNALPPHAILKGRDFIELKPGMKIKGPDGKIHVVKQVFKDAFTYGVPSGTDISVSFKDSWLWTVIDNRAGKNADTSVLRETALNGSSSPWGFFVGEEVVIKHDPEKKKHRIKAIVGGDIILEGAGPRFDASELDTANYAGPYRTTNAVVAKALNTRRVARNANEPVITKLKDQLKKFGWSDADIRGAADEVSRTLMRRGADEAEEIANLYISEAKKQAEKKSAKQKSIKEKIGTLLSKGQQICRQVILHVKKTSADLEKVIQERPKGLGRVDFTGFKSTLNDALKAAQDVLAKMTLSNPTFRGVLNASSAPVNFDSYNATVKKYAQSVHHLAGAIHALDMLQEKVIDIMIGEGINTKGIINNDLADIDYLVGRMSNEWDELLMSKAEYSRFMRELRYNPD